MHSERPVAAYIGYTDKQKLRQWSKLSKHETRSGDLCIIIFTSTNSMLFYIKASNSKSVPWLSLNQSTFLHCLDLSTMSDSYEWGEGHIAKALKQINENAWIVGNVLIHRIEHDSPAHEIVDYAWTDEADRSKYRLQIANPNLDSAQESKKTNILDPVEEAKPPRVKLIHEAGLTSAVWAIGSEIICKVRKLKTPGTTPEWKVLDFVQNQRPSFKTPQAISYTHDANWSYLFMRRVPGRTLDAAWSTLDHYWRDHYANKIVDIIDEMANWKDVENKIGGIDGRIDDRWLSLPGLKKEVTSTVSLSTKMRHTCVSVGMDCDDLVFQHCDLGPTNIIVEEEPHDGTVDVIDFESAGYFPRDWIGTNALVCFGKNLTDWEIPDQWRRYLGNCLRRRKYREFGKEYVEFRNANEES